MPAAPLVAVAPYRLDPGRVSGWTDHSEAVPSLYLGALRRAGALPVVLGGPEDLRPDDLAPFGGVVLVGGGDVEPGAYGEVARPEVYGTDGGRDRFEAVLARMAVELGRPLLGVCRGAQVINVALGGTLWQELSDLHLSTAHGVPVGGGVAALHPVEVQPGSRLAGLVHGATRIERCVSIHHQAARTVAPSLVATAWSPDGLVEAVETTPEGPWCLGVQWHPERSAATDPVQQGLFDGFVAQVRDR